MLFTKKTVIIICIVAALVLGAIAGYVVYDLKLRGSGINVRDKALFDYSLGDVTYIRLMTGNDGERNDFSQEDELENLVTLLNKLEYNKVKLATPTQGYTYSVTVYYESKDTENSGQFIVSSGAVKYNDKIYTLTPESVPVMEEIIALMPGESDETADNRVFPLDDLEGNPVEKIWLQSGNTGEYRGFDSAEDIEWFVSSLKSLTYTEKYELEPSAGWTYRLILDRAWETDDCVVWSTFVTRNEDGRRVCYVLSPESVPIMEEIIALMPGKAEPPQDKNEGNQVFLFDDLESNPVTKISLQSGNTGAYRSFDSTEDIEWFVSSLKSLTYTEKYELEITSGWTCRLIVDRAWWGSGDCMLWSTFVIRNEYSRWICYDLSPESQEIMKEIIARMPD